METGNLEPKTTGNSIGGITPYNVIKGNTIQGTSVNATNLNVESSFTINGNTLLDIFYPVGSIYLSISASSPASWLGGSWTKVSSGYALWTASSGAGNTISAGLPNIKGYIYSRPHKSGLKQYGGAVTATSGAFTFTTQNGPNVANGCEETSTIPSTDTVTFSASSYNSIYGNSSSVQPPAYKVYAWRRTS